MSPHSLAAAFLLPFAVAAHATTWQATVLVSDDATANPAPVIDAGLLNAWGIAASPGGPFWVSSNGAGTATVYSVNPSTQATSKLGLTVTIPGAGNVTGQVFNGNAAAFNGNSFLFVSEDGTVSGWHGGTTAEVLQTGLPANAYKGLAIGTAGGHSYLYAANFAAGSVDVLKGDPGAPALTGSFSDPVLPAGYSPFNVQNLGGSIYVAYAKLGAGNEEVTGAGLGVVDRFDLQGNFLGRIAGGGALDAPWGLAIAPSSFGALAGTLAVGNFGDGRINLYDPAGGGLAGSLNVQIDGLWALAPGNDGNGGSSALLYFTAGPGDESHGVFGVLSAVPEPAGAALWLAGLAAVTGAAARRRQRGA
jgi:uncharacterized protein (TIGR03118 family)